MCGMTDSSTDSTRRAVGHSNKEGHLMIPSFVRPRTTLGRVRSLEKYHACVYRDQVFLFCRKYRIPHPSSHRSKTKLRTGENTSINLLQRTCKFPTNSIPLIPLTTADVYLPNKHQHTRKPRSQRGGKRMSRKKPSKNSASSAYVVADRTSLDIEPALSCATHSPLSEKSLAHHCRLIMTRMPY
jgi:hypothetical protein